MVRGILLDTNVLSELMRQRPDPAVLDWFARTDDELFKVSTVTQAEILLGIALLPGGKRRDALAEAAERMFAEDFAGRCLPFDEAAAREYAVLVAARSRIGAPITSEDGQIAAIALSNGLPLATRNARDFLKIDGLKLVDPWSSTLT
ncbi:MAG: type II toxin-antitoxin system VapC family toxin [Sulfuricella sp.]|nr:type II toxin-antitoxin system VapC family toxin [Sulfuricella sp.]